MDRIVAGGIASSTTVSSGDCSGSTGWVQWSYTVPGQGVYRISATVVNGLDNLIDSFLFVDAHTYQGLTSRS